MSVSLFDLRQYAETGIASPEMTHYDKMKALALCGGGLSPYTIIGQPPLSFKADGTPLISWSMKGNGQQQGTPTPDAPITPDFVGTISGSDWTIPITCAGQTVPVYLGQVSTVRRIKKLVLTGEEAWNSTSGICYLQLIDPDYLRSQGDITYVCTHYTAHVQVNSASQVPTGVMSMAYSTTSQRLYINDPEHNTGNLLKVYLAAQYAAGTPVVIWYVLATPETGIVNEPLMKIGDYCDELTTTTPIPTAKGINTLSVDTTVQPSEMTIKYR